LGIPLLKIICQLGNPHLSHLHVQVRFTLNRIRTCDWMNGRQSMHFNTQQSASGGSSSSSNHGSAAEAADQSTSSNALSSVRNVNKPYIGNFYLVAKPQKFKDSPHEKLLKDTFEI
jgi:hypothetical protein